MLSGALFGGVIAIAVILGYAYDVDDSIRQCFSSTLPGWPFAIRLSAVALAAVGGLVVAVTAHELGHVVMGVCVGFRFHSMRVGRLQVTRPFRWSWSRPVLRGWAGTAAVLPLGIHSLAPRAFAMLLGGPAANLVSAGVIAWLPFAKGAFSASLLFWSLVIGTVNLVPFRRGAFVSDGRRLVMLLRQPAQALRWLSLLVLNAELQDGVEPESLSPDFLATAVAVRDDSFDTVSAHVLAYLSRFYQHDDAGAAAALEACLSHAGDLQDAIREALMCDAAIFQARRRARADLAEAWLAHIPGDTAIPGIREQAEAAILQAKGDRVAARLRLESVEVLLNGRPDTQLAIRLLRRWKADLERG